VSPITIAPCPLAVKAAHEPRPANGFSGMPSTVTATSVRGQPMRTTPSGGVVALAPAACPIRSASSLPASRPAARNLPAGGRPPAPRKRLRAPPPPSPPFLPAGGRRRGPGGGPGPASASPCELCFYPSSRAVAEGATSGPGPVIIRRTAGGRNREEAAQAG